MTGSAHLGGGYVDSDPDVGPTLKAVLAAATPGDPEARLVVLAGPPCSGKSTLARRMLRHLPGAVCIDKDWVAGGFILAAARCDGDGDGTTAYGSARYWQDLRPLEYGGAVTSACAHLVGRRTVFLAGGWGPELANFDFWPDLERAVAPASLDVIHLDAPATDVWQTRMRARGSRADSPWFESFSRTFTATAVWPRAHRVSTDGTIHDVLRDALAILGLAPMKR